MTFSQEYINGFMEAVRRLGHEGDHRGADWSAAYQFLSGEARTLRRKKPDTFRGLRIFVNRSLPPDAIEFHHPDGRVDRLVGLPKRKRR